MCRKFYEKLRDWIVETEFDRYRSGRIFEYIWPVMFGEPAVTEPIEECDLLHCTAEDRLAASAPSPSSSMHYITTTNTREVDKRRARNT
jgi:hypothetical protein